MIRQFENIDIINTDEEELYRTYKENTEYNQKEADRLSREKQAALDKFKKLRKSIASPLPGILFALAVIICIGSFFILNKP